MRADQHWPERSSFFGWFSLLRDSGFLLSHFRKLNPYLAMFIYKFQLHSKTVNVPGQVQTKAF